MEVFRADGHYEANCRLSQFVELAHYCGMPRTVQNLGAVVAVGSGVAMEGVWGVQTSPPKFRKPSKIVPNSTRL